MKQIQTTSPTLKLPLILTIGKTTIRLETDETTIQEFIDGMTAGHLAYMAQGRKAHLFDTDLILLVVQRYQMRQATLAFNGGYVTGYLSTLARKGTYYLSNASFCDGYHEGLHTYCLLRHRHTFTQDELCSLIGWQHQEQNSAYNAGYVVGFLQGVTLGTQVVREHR